MTAVNPNSPIASGYFFLTPIGSCVMQVALPILCAVGAALLLGSYPAIIGFAIVGAAAGYGLRLTLEKIFASRCVQVVSAQQGDLRAATPAESSLRLAGSSPMSKQEVLSTPRLEAPAGIAADELDSKLRSFNKPDQVMDDAYFLKLTEFCNKLTDHECQGIQNYIETSQNDKQLWFSSEVKTKDSFCKIQKRPLDLFITHLIALIYTGYHECWNSGEITPVEDTMGENYKKMKQDMSMLIRVVGDANCDALFTLCLQLPVANAPRRTYTIPVDPAASDDQLKHSFSSPCIKPPSTIVNK